MCVCVFMYVSVCVCVRERESVRDVTTQRKSQRNKKDRKSRERKKLNGISLTHFTNMFTWIADRMRKFFQVTLVDNMTAL